MPTQRERTLLAALRQNLALLQELAIRYETGSLSTSPKVDLPLICHPGDAALLLRTEMEGLAQEQLRVLLLDTRNRVIGHHLVYQGNVSSITIRPAEVFREALLANAPKILIAHNHPSGDAEPSPEDVRVTGQLLQGAQLLGIELLDHLVIGRGTEVSLRGRGLPGGGLWSN